MYKKFEMELAGRTLRVDVGRVAKQANGAALMHYGDTVVLSTATASENQEMVSISSHFQLNMRKMYSVGKILEDSTSVRVRQARTQSLHPVLSTVR